MIGYQPPRPTGQFQPPGPGRIPQPAPYPTAPTPLPPSGQPSAPQTAGFVPPTRGVGPGHPSYGQPFGVPRPNPTNPFDPRPRAPTNPGTPGGGNPLPQIPQLPGGPQTPGGPQPPATPNRPSTNVGDILGGLLGQIQPMHLPTNESQNQLMALAHQRANPVQALNRAVGSSGVQAGSGIMGQKLMGDMMGTYKQGALGAANLGIDDQLMRDEHLLKGIVGLGGLDIERQRSGADRERIGLNAQDDYINAIIAMLGGLGSAFSVGNLSDSFGDIAGAF